MPLSLFEQSGHLISCIRDPPEPLHPLAALCQLSHPFHYPQVEDLADCEEQLAPLAELDFIKIAGSDRLGRTVVLISVDNLQVSPCPSIRCAAAVCWGMLPWCVSAWAGYVCSCSHPSEVFLRYCTRRCVHALLCVVL